MKPSSQSREVFKSIVDNGAVTNFQGKIYVDSVAQKTDGYQMSRSLILDNDSKANKTQPNYSVQSSQNRS